MGQNFLSCYFRRSKEALLAFNVLTFFSLTVFMGIWSNILCQIVFGNVEVNVPRIQRIFRASELSRGSWMHRDNSQFPAFVRSYRPLVPRNESSSHFSDLFMTRKSKDIIHSDACREHLLNGIEQVAKLVRVTLGPRGRNVLLEKEYGGPMIVNDGVTIARNIRLKDPREDAGAKLVQEVATTSDDRAGDGTTSTAILTSEICRKGVSYVNLGHSPIQLQEGIQKATRLAVDKIKSIATPVEGYKDLLNIATVATSGNSVMGHLIANAFSKLGSSAAIVLEENPALEDALEFTEGYTFDRGMAHLYFSVGEERGMIDWKNPKILVCEFKIEGSQDMIPLLERFAKTKEPLFIIADDFGTEALQFLLLNKMQGYLKVIPVKAPSFGERRKDALRDIATATNAKLVSKDFGMSLEDVKLEDLGTAQGVVVRKDRTSILTDPKFAPSINERIDALKVEVEAAKSKFDKEKLNERIAALSGGVGKILIGAATETEQKEKRLRYEDAINAVRAAAETGYVPGGGVTYLLLSEPEFQQEVMQSIENDAKLSLQEEQYNNEKNYSAGEMESEVELRKAGAKLVLDVMPSITKQIADNAGMNGEKLVKIITESKEPFGFGWNAKTNKFGNLVTQGVVDPAKVIISAIENSASVAGLVLTTEGMMVDEEESSKVSKDAVNVSGGEF